MPLTKHCRIRRQKLLIVKDNYPGNNLHLTNFEIERITKIRFHDNHLSPGTSDLESNQKHHQKSEREKL